MLPFLLIFFIFFHLANDKKILQRNSLIFNMDVNLFFLNKLWYLFTLLSSMLFSHFFRCLKSFGFKSWLLFLLGFLFLLFYSLLVKKVIFLFYLVLKFLWKAVIYPAADYKIDEAPKFFSWDLHFLISNKFDDPSNWLIGSVSQFNIKYFLENWKG